MPPRGRGRGCGSRGRGRGEPAPEDPLANPDLAAILAKMQTMRAEMNALRQAPVGGANLGRAPGAPGGAPGNALGANPGGAPVVPPERLLTVNSCIKVRL
jgi:hypothetical protein